MNRETEPIPNPTFESISTEAIELFWTKADVNPLTEGPYLIDYIRFAYKRQVSTPEQAGRILVELLTMDAIIDHDIAMELGAAIGADVEPIPDIENIDLASIVDGLICFSMERTLLVQNQDIYEEDMRRCELANILNKRMVYDKMIDEISNIDPPSQP